MRRKEKRLLQAVALVLAALVLLPNVGLWALYRERQPDGTPGGSGAAVVPAAGLGPHNQQKKIFFLGDGQKLKDWHDQEAIRRDAQRLGNGEQGRPYPMTDAERVDQAYRENGFNIYVSDKISLNRSLPDIRHPKNGIEGCLCQLCLLTPEAAPRTMETEKGKQAIRPDLLGLCMGGGQLALGGPAPCTACRGSRNREIIHLKAAREHSW
uniref:Polypeptide N-acetylgalactosaminyltransferase 10 n=1 Tax=Suricata suricatta TaxID=37032 RepID=A0A673UQB7_SURSU